jgi:mono/diheme cytochrome c family protein
MRGWFLGVMLVGCGADSEEPDGEANDSSTDDTGTARTDDSGTDDSGTNDSGTDDSGTDAESIERGGAIVQSVCNHCHEPYNSLAVRIEGFDDDDIASVIRNGSGYMPPQDLDADEIADVIAYLRATYPD